jgi:purine-nucleoside phosphorylase
VPEVITARAMGVRCMGFSMVTNKGTGLSHEPIGHEEVIEVGRKAGAQLGKVIAVLAGLLSGAVQSTGEK